MLEEPEQDHYSQCTYIHVYMYNKIIIVSVPTCIHVEQDHYSQCTSLASIPLRWMRKGLGTLLSNFLHSAGI